MYLEGHPSVPPMQNYAMPRTLCKKLNSPGHNSGSKLFVIQSPLLRLTLALLLLPLPLHLTPNLTHCSEQLPEPKAPPLDPHAPDKEVHECPIADAECEEDAKVAPLIARLDIQRG